jgi:hypothetical protein
LAFYENSPLWIMRTIVLRPVIFRTCSIYGLIHYGGIYSKKLDFKKAAYLLFVLGVFFAFRVLAVRYCAEKALEHIGGISKIIFHGHEANAEVFAMQAPWTENMAYWHQAIWFRCRQ